MANKKVKIELTAVNKTKRAFSNVTSGLKGVGGAAKTASKAVAGVGLAAVGVVAALTVLTKKSLDYVDAIGKTATRTGIATDFIQAFQQGAIEAGSSIEQAQKGLEKFSRSVGDASRGLKTQADIFSDLGVEIRDTSGAVRGNTEILLEVADGIAALGSAAEKSTALANLFGKSGMQFAQIFEGGAEGLKNFVEEFRQLGFIISESGIRTAETFNDRVSQIKASIFGLQNQIVVGLAPAFLKLADDLKQFIIEQAAASGGFEQFGKDIAVSIIGIAQATASAFASVINFINGLAQVDKTVINLGISLLKLRGFDDLEFVSKDNIIDIDQLNSKFEELLLKVNESSPAIKKFMEEFSGGLTNLQDPLAVFVTNIEKVNTSLQNVAVQSMKKLEDSIVDGLKTGKLAFEDFATFVVEQLLRIAIQQMIIAPMTRSIGSFLGVKIPSGDGGGYTGMGARAGGVDGKGGFPAILHPNETVIDHTKGQGISSGATVNFNISTVDAAGFDQLLASRKGLITSIINNAMNNQGKMGVV